LIGRQASARVRAVNAGGGGMLVLVAGPSGAGKDTLLEGARQALAGDPRLRFVRRVITRPAEAGGEDHEAVSETEYAARDFALQWDAHGLRYGIPADIADDLALGVTVVASVSRGVIAAAARRFPVRVIDVTAPSVLLAERLRARGREDAAGVAERLGRSLALPAGVAVTTVMNDGSIGEGVDRFLRALVLVRGGPQG